MSEMHDAWFFIGVFVFIFLLWIVTGGPLHPLAFTGPQLAEPGALGGGTYLSLPKAPYGVGGSNVVLPGSSSGNPVSPYTGAASSSSHGEVIAPYTTTNSGTSIPTLTSNNFGTISPYRGVVNMNHYVSSPSAPDPANEYIEITVSQNSGTAVDISGWTLRSTVSGNVAVIPQGTEVLTSGVVNNTNDILLTPGKRAIIISGRSPIGASFRENKCIGYLSTFQSFTPSLPQNCPAPTDELVAHYGNGYVPDGACIEYVNRLSRCQEATGSGICKNTLLQYLNYNGCVNEHRSDGDFIGDTWHVYLGRRSPLWRSQNDIVKLIDLNGNTVDAFSY